MTTPNPITPTPDHEARRRDSNGRILCEFCDAPAVLQNCRFWPVTQEDSISGPFDLCLAHYEAQDDYAGSAGGELEMPGPARPITES
jgi:hypothetical protein